MTVMTLLVLRYGTSTECESIGNIANIEEDCTRMRMGSITCPTQISLSLSTLGCLQHKRRHLRSANDPLWLTL